jgi:hypothetical protein
MSANSKHASRMMQQVLLKFHFREEDTFNIRVTPPDSIRHPLTFTSQ